jgi:broad specificity phosphatase PhoE
LNARGRSQADALGRRLLSAPPDRIVSSPVERARETAMIIAAHVGRPVEFDERLIETGMGQWEGMAIADIIARYAEEWRAWRSAPASQPVPWIESVDAIADRMSAAARDYLRNSERVALVSHQDPLMALVCRWLDLPLDAMRRIDLSPGSLSIFEVAWTRMTLVTLNSVPV